MQCARTGSSARDKFIQRGLMANEWRCPFILYISSVRRCFVATLEVISSPRHDYLCKCACFVHVDKAPLTIRPRAPPLWAPLRVFCGAHFAWLLRVQVPSLIFMMHPSSRQKSPSRWSNLFSIYSHLGCCRWCRFPPARADRESPRQKLKDIRFCTWKFC